MQASKDFKLTSGLLIVALAIGGAGLSFPLLQMLLGICALGVAGYFVWTRQARLSPFARVALALAFAALALTALQLIPLPPFLWRALPGRDVPLQVDDALGQAYWRPWTLDVEATIRSLLVLIPAVVVFAGCVRLPTLDRMKLARVIVVFGVIGAVLGILQLASGGNLTPYPSAHLGYPIGLFVNRNHNAALLLVSIPIAASLGATQVARGRPSLPTTAATLAVIAVLAIVVIATTSRMGLLLLPLAMAVSLVLLFFGQSLWRVAIPSFVALAALGVVIIAGGGFSRTLTRFSSLHDSRFDYWTDVVWALQHYGIAGTGFGTFVPVYQSAESLAGVSSSVLNHAHNDYVEILLEGGLPAILLLVLFFAFLGVCAFRLTRSKLNLERALMSLAAASGILILLLFSLVDYPLRMPALSSVFAVLCSLVVPRVHGRTQRQLVPVEDSSTVSRHTHGLPGATRLALLVLIAAAAVVTVQAGISSHDLLAGRDSQALHVAPWSTEANEQLATKALLQGRSANALYYANGALTLSPISAPAIRTIGLVRLSGGSAGASHGLMDVAAALGWRDTLTQLWAIDAAKRSGEFDKAVERADALLQQHLYQPAILTLLEGQLNPRLEEALVADLAQNPEWRTAFLQSGRDLPTAFLPSFEQLIVQLGRTSAPPTLRETQPLVDRLLQLGRLDDARRVWSAARRDTLLLNGSFERVDTGGDGNAPSDWSISAEDADGLDVGRPEAGDDTRALRIYDTRDSTPIISQQLMLLPGTYQIAFRAYEKPASGSILRWEIRCLETGTDIGSNATLSGESWQQFSLTLSVPNQNCSVQRLALERLGDIHPHELWIDDVVLEAEAR
jgi:O-antigen ligase